ncbi:MAG: cupin domain-containing protein [Gemmatimonadales bacterium]|nr:cupin domain-containing protein [Gemmatimonadales bacterium]
MPLPTPTNLRDELGQVRDHWSPRVIAALNGQYLKVVKVQGEFVWHQHDAEDELFLIIKGSLRIQFGEGDVVLREGECLVVPRGVRHRPVAEEECWLALFEPAETAHTGEVQTDRTRTLADQTAHLRSP